MIKRLSTILIVALIGVAGAWAQQKNGRWQLYPSISETWTNVVETPGKTYLHNGPTLFSISDDDNESYVYNSFNKLSTAEAIELVRYNAAEKYLFVAYADGNIDLIYDDGKVVNMAEIKDAMLSTTRGINSVAFADGRIYVATDFGLVVYDSKRHLVLESGIFGKDVAHIFVMGDHLVLLMGNSLMAAPLEGRHNTESCFTAIGDIFGTDMAKISDTMLAFLHTSKVVYSTTIDFGTMTQSRRSMEIGGVDKLYQLPEGFYALEEGNIAVSDASGNVTRTPRPEAYAKARLFFNTLKSVWASTQEGFTRLDLSGSTPTVLMQPYRPDAITASVPAQLEWTADGSRLYVANLTFTHFYTCAGTPYHGEANVSMIEGNKITDVVPMYVEHPTSSVDFDRICHDDKTDRFGGGSQQLATDPNDPSTYYLSSIVAGVFVVRDGELVNIINSSNTPYTKAAWAEHQNGVEFDPEGNLWVGNGVEMLAENNGEYTPIWFVLPAAKVRNIANVTKTDWIPVPGICPTFRADRDMNITFLRRSPYNIYVGGGWNRGFMVQSTSGTPMTFSDDTFVHHTHVIDQNGNTLNPTFTISVVEDLDGAVWFGTDQGLYYISDIKNAMGTSTPQVHRPVVPRNDGTGLGDYLLETQKINKIAVDHSNRKWIATETSGVYLVSADGTEIIANYTAENSALPSNTVYSVSVSPTDNVVYFGTANGLASFDSDSSPAADDYTEVYAYPNPVRPDYTGWITIAGLMDDSLVKIADAAGNVFFQGRSEGGMISWDGCDAGGNRVRSGVYYVFASQNATGSASGAVTKILVIN